MYIDKENNNEVKMFVKPRRVTINITLQKDLHSNEEICQVCQGTGLIVSDNSYGLSDDPDKTAGIFPYKHQSLMFCPYCYNGVVRRCPLCNKIIRRGFLKCDCEKQRDIDDAKRAEKEWQALNDAPIAPTELVEKYGVFYSDNYDENEGYFTDWEDFFENWYNCYDILDSKPKYVWLAEPYEMRIDARNLIESATEDMYEDACHDISEKEERKLQDFLDSWCKDCGVGITYYQSKYKVKIPWEDYDNGN